MKTWLLAFVIAIAACFAIEKVYTDYKMDQAKVEFAKAGAVNASHKIVVLGDSFPACKTNLVLAGTKTSLSDDGKTVYVSVLYSNTVGAVVKANYVVEVDEINGKLYGQGHPIDPVHVYNQVRAAISKTCGGV